VKATAVKPITEKTFQAQVTELARLLGWVVYHTFDARRSAPGFPDLLLISPSAGRLIVCELKVGDRRPTAAQGRWLELFKACGIETYCWRPSSWADIERTLKGER
jgi:hypothetical protein